MVEESELVGGGEFLDLLFVVGEELHEVVVLKRQNFAHIEGFLRNIGIYFWLLGLDGYLCLG